MTAIEVDGLSYRYGRISALRDVDLSVPEGALCALLGPNGSGKTTLMQILMGLRRPTTGRVSLLGTESTALTVAQRAEIAYIAEGQSLPGWMRLAQVEAYLAPLYPRWDAALADDLRARFDLDPRRRVQSLSRGEQMKAALLCALAPRPRLLLMDEPFTGMDALVKDDLVRGLLDSAGSEGWTVLVASHDIGELELLADSVAFLANGHMHLAEPMETLRDRFKQIEIVPGDGVELSTLGTPLDVWALERSVSRLGAIVSHAPGVPLETVLRMRFPQATRIAVHDASLREIFVALARRAALEREVAA